MALPPLALHAKYEILLVPLNMPSTAVMTVHTMEIAMWVHTWLCDRRLFVRISCRGSGGGSGRLGISLGHERLGLITLLLPIDEVEQNGRIDGCRQTSLQ